MYILVVGQVENDNVYKQIAKQTLQPNATFIFLDKHPADGIDDRRRKIVVNHMTLMSAVEEIKPDLVWQLEGDGELPVDTLERLYNHYLALKGSDFGYISGVEVGRHGLKAIGAWHFNGNRSRFRSLDRHKTGIQEVDATGFYCLLAERKVWLSGLCTWDGERWGPDVNFGLSLRKQGYKIYCDTALQIGHKTPYGDLYPSDLSACNVEFSKDPSGKWSYKTS